MYTKDVQIFLFAETILKDWVVAWIFFAILEMLHIFATSIGNTNGSAVENQSNRVKYH